MIATFCGNFFIITFISILNSFALKQIEDSFNVTVFDFAAQGINSITYINYESFCLMTIFVVYFRLNQVRKFLSFEFENQNNFREKNLLKALKSVADVVDKLCDAVESIKFCHTINLVDYTLHYLMLVIFSVYGASSYVFRQNSTKNDKIFALMTLTWTALYTPFIIFLFLISNMIKGITKSIENTIQSILNKRNLDLKTRKTAQLLFLQLHHRRPLISCGFFVIDWYLLFYLIGIGYSYLVIITQFEWKTFN